MFIIIKYKYETNERLEPGSMPTSRPEKPLNTH